MKANRLPKPVPKLRPGQTEITCYDCWFDFSGLTNNWIFSSQKDTIAFVKEHGKLHLNPQGKPYWDLMVHHIFDTTFSTKETSHD